MANLKDTIIEGNLTITGDLIGGLKSVVQNIGNVTIASSGYNAITKPTEVQGHLMVAANVETWGSNTGAFLITTYSTNSNSYYITGTPGAVITNLVARLWYI